MPELEELHTTKATNFKSQKVLKCTANAVCYPHALDVGCQDLRKAWPSLAAMMIRAILSPNCAVFLIAEDPAARSFSLIKLALLRVSDADDHSFMHAVNS